MDFDELFIDAQNESYNDEKFKSALLDNTIFSEIPNIAPQNAEWIDGGSATIITTPARAIALIKVCTISTKAQSREKISLQSALISITLQNDAFIIRQKLLQGGKLELPSRIDRTELHDDNKSITPEILIDTIRAVAERNIANGISGIVFIDGSVRSDNKYLQKLSCNNNITSVSKTSSLLTSKNRPISTALISRSPNGKWQATIQDVCYAKFHEKATHVFAVEGNINPSNIATLCAWSNDISFLGYPYPYILSDQMARVTNNERDMWRTIILTGKNGAVLQNESNSSNAHDVLEHILYGKES